MQTALIRLVRFLPSPFRERVRVIFFFVNKVLWILKGKPVPPPHIVKIETIKSVSEKFGLDVLVETGTYMGDTIDILKSSFSEIYSIELDEKLFKRAKKLFKDFPGIKIIQGDSTVILPKLIKKYNKPVLFWLDAHYSGIGTARGKENSPVSQELKAILNHKVKNHVILIDDAREFVGREGYPKLGDLKAHLKKNYPQKRLSVKNDIIKIV
jgi:hypothetical protein